MILGYFQKLTWKKCAKLKIQIKSSLLALSRWAVLAHARGKRKGMRERGTHIWFDSCLLILLVASVIGERALGTIESRTLGGDSGLANANWWHLNQPCDGEFWKKSTGCPFLYFLAAARVAILVSFATPCTAPPLQCLQQCVEVTGITWRVCAFWWLCPSNSTGGYEKTYLKEDRNLWDRVR